MTGLTVTLPGGGFAPVCLDCSRRLMVTTRWRSHALIALEDHQAHACPARHTP